MLRSPTVKTKTNMTELTVDDVFRKIGQFGKAQKIYFLIIGTVSFVTAFHVFATTFVDFSPGWSCQEHAEDAGDGTPCVDVKEGRCTIQYEKDSPLTIVTEWDLVCDTSYWSRIPQSMYFAGTTIGSVVLGSVGDKYGRRSLTLWCTGLSILFAGLSSIAINAYMYSVMRFCVGFCAQGMILGLVVWIFEITGPDRRSSLQALNTSFFVVGGMLLPGISLLFPNWRHVLMIFTLVGLLPLLLSRYVPESPSWLLVSGRKEEAKLVLKRIAEGNNSVLPTDLHLKAPEDKPQEAKGFLALFSFSAIATRSTIQFICWFIICCTYYGVAFVLGDSLGGNRYLNFSIGVFVEIPSLFIALYIADKFGRCKGLSGLCIASGVCLIGSIVGGSTLQTVAPSASVFIKVALAITGRLGNAAAFALAYFYATELFPTEVRNVGIGLVSVGARSGGIVSPFVLYVNNVGIPIVLMGVLSVCAGVLSLRLPETKGKPTPETLEELRKDADSVMDDL